MKPFEIALLITLVVVVVAVIAVVWYRRQKKKRAAAREKLLKNEVSGYDATDRAEGAGGKEYRAIYRKAALKASVEGNESAEDLESQRTSKQTSGRSEASSKGPGPLNKKASEATSDDILQVVVGSWYEHLIRHSATEYLRLIVKNSEGMTEKDLIPEMRMLLAAIPDVALERWSRLSSQDKNTITVKVKDLKADIIASASKRFPPKRS